MLYGLYLSAAGMQAQELRQTVITNNLANSQTNGFKRDLMLIQSRPNAVDEDPQMAKYRIPIFDQENGGILPGSGGIDLRQASLVGTHNATDLALDGPGFFTVRGDEPNQKLLTRDGKFLLANDGTLVTATGGRPVLSADGQPIQLNPDPTLPIHVSSTGAILQGDNTVAQLGITDVGDPAQLVKLGGNLMTSTQPDSFKPVDSSTIVRQYHLEESGVDPIVEMVNMMEGQRAFEANAKMISYQDTTLSQLNTIGRVA